jgi:hypothetical protein
VYARAEMTFGMATFLMMQQGSSLWPYYLRISRLNSTLKPPKHYLSGWLLHAQIWRGNDFESIMDTSERHCVHVSDDFSIH